MVAIWERIKQEPALAFGVLIAVLEAVNATLPHAPDWLQVVIAVVLAIGGAVGIRAKVTPV